MARQRKSRAGGAKLKFVTSRLRTSTAELLRRATGSSIPITEDEGRRVKGLSGTHGGITYTLRVTPGFVPPEPLVEPIRRTEEPVGRGPTEGLIRALKTRPGAKGELLELLEKSEIAVRICITKAMHLSSENSLEVRDILVEFVGDIRAAHGILENIIVRLQNVRQYGKYVDLLIYLARNSNAFAMAVETRRPQNRTTKRVLESL